METKGAWVLRQAALTVAIVVGYHLLYRYFTKRESNPDEPASGTQRDAAGGEVPDDCPGVDTPEAGTKSACQGCPNQAKCASGELKNENEKMIASVAANLGEVKKVVLVMSGKGGVGKSTVSTQLSYMLSARGHHVGLLDIDLTGPSVPGMTSTESAEVFESARGWTPVYVSDRLSVISIGHMLRNTRESIIWRGPKKDSLIKQFLIGVDWGRLDYLVVDCPPGSSDEHITICNLLKGVDTLAVLVTTPQQRCVDDVYRSAAFCEKAGIRIAALVQNMTQSVFDITKPEVVGELCQRFGIRNVLCIPLRPDIVTAGEEGRPMEDFTCIDHLEKFIHDDK
ncbi:nucleotide-binding protein 1, putative [Babesia bigemina]|uniref:Nucleotide-binding protein 1, putative n=1 Tax=Babesia bigemina TaxID=5866 RepID=A0A061DB95_BABBI|nr:nucleotide-binding protein 1, putative [Babesia bigemina]CDR97966.1 nucleotide-binding protein 1, putative [Babesia bigemina]|eukprot:XP_012770152.1 nucleotide-binding protein 1, putative [Babesia bigemina]